ncbi:MAG: dicarboxylate transporter, DctP subunit [Candidatus Eremiobacteraeota bacterium]|nr:dicarboxylate transporter, DctP subunit [Candidatus Eremiobacteraeota bacterium]
MKELLGMNRTLTRGAFAAGSVAAIASVAIVRGKAKAADFTMKYGTTEPVDSPINVLGTKWFDRIRKETNGRVDIQLFPANVLGGLSAMVTQLRSGALHFCTVDGITLSTVVEAAAIQGVAFAFKDAAHGFRAFDGDLGAYVRKDIQAKGLYAHDRMLVIGMRHVTSNLRPIQKPEDLANFKIRTPPGRLSLDLFKAFGASPVPMNFSELYTSLQTRVVDGEENSLNLINQGRFFEVQKYLSLTAHQWSGYWLCGNLEAWNGIPADLQAIVSRNFTGYVMEQRQATEHVNTTLRTTLAQHMAVNSADPGPFRARLGSFYQSWKAQFGPTPWSLLEKYTGKLA